MRAGERRRNAEGRPFKQVMAAIDDVGDFVPREEHRDAEEVFRRADPQREQVEARDDHRDVAQVVVREAGAEDQERNHEDIGAQAHGFDERRVGREQHEQQDRPANEQGDPDAQLPRSDALLDRHRAPELGQVEGNGRGVE
jgi:hypothetical protein